MEDTAQLLSVIMDVGETMLISGAEVNRVENTIEHMGKAYGFTRVDVLTITSSIIVTVHGPEGNIVTQTRRIKHYDTNMRKVELCNGLSRRICKETMSVEELRAELEKIEEVQTYPGWLVFLAYGMVAAAFTGFFGGSAGDMVTSFISGLALRVVQLAGHRLKVQNIVLTVICAAVSGTVIVWLVQAGLGVSVDKVIIGNIMLLIPGIALTTSLRDMISGDLISGLLGLCEAVIRAIAIAVGVAVALWMGGGL